MKVQRGKWNSYEKLAPTDIDTEGIYLLCCFNYNHSLSVIMLKHSQLTFAKFWLFGHSSTFKMEEKGEISTGVPLSMTASY